MNILLIGQSVIDEIDSPEGKFTKPGGIFYSVTAFVQFIDSVDEYYLITNLDETSKNLFNAAYKSVNTQYVTLVDNIPKLNLTICKDKERSESYQNSALPLSIPYDLDFYKIDGVFINMITGFDISLKQLGVIRKKCGSLIYFDVHTLAKAFDSELKLEYRPIPQIRNWLENIDILQANESELNSILPDSPEHKTAEFILNSGVKIFILTKAEKGVKLYYRDGKEICFISKPAIKVNVVNKVGCGDVFGAIFFYSYIKNGNIFSSLDFANVSAGVSTTYLRIEDFKNLKKDAERFYD